MFEGKSLVETTLDEPVRETIMRDLREVGAKLKLVVLPRASQAGVLERLKEWDLWGPLLVCLSLSMTLCVAAVEKQRALVFAAVFVVVWAGAAIVTLNAQLLGGSISFFQSVCVLGYSIFPLNIASLGCVILGAISRHTTLLRCALVTVAFAWATRVSVVFFSEIIGPERKALALYPVFAFFAFLAWMILIQ